MAGALALLTGALYLPFLSNALVFDDRFLFTGARFAEYAASPFGPRPRWPALSSVAFVHVVWGTIEAHRLVSLLLHFGCAWALYALVRELQRHYGVEGRAAAFAGAAAFALHPVAVYGAGYLQQRSIVLATLFSLLALAVFVRGLRLRSYSLAVAAAALFSVAVLSKEHCLLLPLIAAAPALARPLERRFAVRYAALHAACCAPAALLVISMVRGYVGGTYEADFQQVVAQIPQSQWAQVNDSSRLGSALAQAALYFHYLLLWVAPRTAAMSLDLRPDIADLWAPAIAVPAVLGFVGWGVLAVFLMRRGGRLGLIGFGLAVPWVLYLLEFSVVRVQEPFVLYRSYLWGPGVAIACAGLLGGLRPRWVVVALLVALPVLMLQSYDRLRSLRSGLAAWEDAVAKLPPGPVPGGWRPLYGLGREYLYAGADDKAHAVVARCLAEYPQNYHCLFARAALELHREAYEAAIPHLLRAIAAAPERGIARHHLGVALEMLGCVEEARAQYEESRRVGFMGAQQRLDSLDAPGRGLAVPLKPLPRRRADCASLTRSAAPPPD